MATLDEVRDSIQAALASALTGIKYKPVHPTETLPQYPALVVYTQLVNWNVEMGAAGKIGLADVVAEVHVSRSKGLHRAIDELQPYMESIANEMFSALATTVGAEGGFTQRFTFGQISVELVASEWGTDQTMAARATISGVKVRNSVS